MTEAELKEVVRKASEPVMSQVAEIMAANPAGPHIFKVDCGIVKPVTLRDYMETPV